MKGLVIFVLLMLFLLFGCSSSSFKDAQRYCEQRVNYYDFDNCYNIYPGTHNFLDKACLEERNLDVINCINHRELKAKKARCYAQQDLDRANAKEALHQCIKEFKVGN